MRSTAVTLRRLRRLLFTQRFTDREETGVLISVDVELPMNGFMVDIIAYNNAVQSNIVDRNTIFGTVLRSIPSINGWSTAQENVLSHKFPGLESSQVK